MSDTIRRLYMDNAATSFPKPRAVHEAMAHYAIELGASAGRGAYREAIETAGLLAQCRQRLCRLFNGERPEHFIFTLNCSDALNLAIKGIMLHWQLRDSARRPHAICSDIDHNSILRPFNALRQQGVMEFTRLPVDPITGLLDPQAVANAIRPNTRLIAITHASNVTGTVQDVRAMGQVARDRDIPLLVDAAQSAGHLPIDVRTDGIDLLAAPGHKGLLGPLGTGFLYIRPGIEKILLPVREGGTGSISEQDTQPEFLPDRYESGSHNAIGLVGLSAGVNWILEEGVEKIAAHDIDLVRTFIEGIMNIPSLKWYGPQGVKHRLGVFSLRIEGLDPHELSAILESRYGILTRSGIHCAPRAHATVGTAESGGATRFSFGPFLTVGDVNYATDCLAEIADQL